MAYLTDVVSSLAVSYSSQQIANAFLTLAKEQGKSLTNMQVQKLVYYANGFNLALNEKPLIKDEVKAWNFGPVIPTLYNDLKQFGNGFVTAPIPDYEVPGKGDDFTWALLRRVFELYGNVSGARLSAATHLAGSPWDKTYKGAKFSVIPSDLIKDYFKSRLIRDPSATAA